MTKPETYDLLVIGGGLFGVYAALHFAAKGMRVALVEKEKQLFRKASVVNQARLHGGYHYPRSVATARMSDEHKARFTEEHRDAINFSFSKYYAIDKFGSLTDPAQFERFCRFINIPLRRVEDHPLFNYSRIDALYETTEYSFDPFLIARYYEEQVRGEQGIDLYLYQTIAGVNRDGGQWQVSIRDLSSEKNWILQTPNVLNATYAGSNGIHELFGLAPLQLMYEIAEIALVSAPLIQDIGLTVMDGPFGSVMPYGKTGLLSVSSVAYTHHKVSYALLPTFDCQAGIANCTPSLVGDCNDCPARPSSNFRKMLGQMRGYFSEQVQWHYFSSLFTVKSKLKANFIDDGRPTEINCLHENPHFYCIFAGKINSIYEIEKIRYDR